MLGLVWETETWVNSSRWNCNYTVDNEMLESISQFWQDTAWENRSKTNYTYDSEFLIERTFQSWESSNWKNNLKHEHTFEGSNNTFTVYSTWVGTAWTDTDKFDKYYNVDNNMIEQILQSWTGSSWRNSSRTIYTYINTGIQVDNTISEWELSQNYPNPFNPSTKINYSIPMRSNVRLVVYNAIGEEVAELVNSKQSKGVHSVDFKVNNLTSGIYFYNLIVNNKVTLNKKMILSK